eukprot:g3185.t1
MGLHGRRQCSSKPVQNSTAGVPVPPVRPLVITERGSANLPPPPDRKWTAAEVDALTMKVQHLASGVPPPATVPEVETPGVGGDTGPAPGPCKRPRATHFGAASFIAGDISSTAEGFGLARAADRQNAATPKNARTPATMWAPRSKCQPVRAGLDWA